MEKDLQTLRVLKHRRQTKRRIKRFSLLVFVISIVLLIKELMNMEPAGDDLAGGEWVYDEKNNQTASPMMV